MVTKGVLIALVVIAFAGVVGVASRARLNVPQTPTSSPIVAAENVSVNASFAPIVLPQGTSNPTSTISTSFVSAVHTTITTPSPTPAPTPTQKKDGNWTVSDSGKDSNPRKASISYESEDANANTSVNISQSSSHSGNATVNSSMRIKVTVDNDTREINN